MIVTCPNCSCKYNIPENKIGDSPKRFRCRKCSEVFIINPLKSKEVRTEEVSPDQDSPEQKAARFARVLASDMLIYNRDLIVKAREDGNLPDVMNMEIQKSWDLWKSKFQKESENNPGIFTDALNQYLADGKKVFENQDYS